MSHIPCAVESALNDHYRKQQSGEELWEESEKELFSKIDPLIDSLKEAIKNHVRFNDAGMDYSDARNYVIETIGELL